MFCRVPWTVLIISALYNNIDKEALGPLYSAWEPTWPFAKVPHIFPFYPRGRKNFTLGAAVSEIRADFQNCHFLGMKLDHWPKCQKLHSSLSTHGMGSKLSLFFFALWATVSKTLANFQNCHIWAWNLDNWPNCQKLHIYTLFPH